ncbi:hypothetical protein K7X08_029349 [Anisodus acutangulus]|uniref:Uncharacterized protein n=1 Tax=Anisodus acutangulus TaxID=402998 RepID=A0A9Q1L251_9SOLA|nr:hypothetical protein K7X08_029349 [Anisodus acutangulus]
MKNDDQERFLFGISLFDRPKWQQFLICSSGFFFGYLVNGLCEEYVYNRLGFSYGWYFTFVQDFVYLFLIRLQGFTTKQMVNPWKTYVKLAVGLMCSHGLTKGSLAYLNYPAQIMFKSTKVLPVMVVGAFMPSLRRKYPLQEYVSAMLFVGDLIFFTLADANTSPNFSIIGVIMITGAPVMDSFLDGDAVLLNGCRCTCSTFAYASICLRGLGILINGHVHRSNFSSIAHCYFWGCYSCYGNNSKKGSDAIVVILDLY